MLLNKTNLRCFFSSEIGEEGSFAKFADREKKHLFRTLRARKGDSILLIDGKGSRAEAEIADKENIIIRNIHKINEPEIKLHLYLSPPRHQKMDQLLKQCAEIGLWSINPIITTHSVSIPQKSGITERWQNLLIEGCKQSHNPFLPKIAEPIPFNQAVEEAKKQGFLSYFGSLSAKPDHGFPITDHAPRTTDLGWWVGPEGGFSPEEKEIMLEAEFKPMQISSWTLRTETAAIVGVGILRSFFE